VVRCLLVVLVSVPLWAQQRWCAADSKYAATITRNVNDLRWGLEAASKRPDIEPALLAKLAENSITSLSNLHSLRSDYLRKCDKTPEEYYSVLAGNEGFSTIFVRTITAEEFRKGDEPSAVELDRLLTAKSAPREFKFVETIERVIHRRMDSSRDHSSALWVACAELDGAAAQLEIKEGEIRPSPIVPTRRDNPLTKPYGEVLPTLKKLTTRETFTRLADYYQEQD
jgi:hypothetical protein